MGIIQTIYGWLPWSGERKLEALPFEELQESAAENPVGAYEEFVRRMQRLVFYAAEEYLQRNSAEVTREATEEKVSHIFEEFSPQFGSGDPSTILLRFAAVIRRELDDEAFRVIGLFFYKQLPTYHISDNDARIILAASYQEALSNEGSLKEALAERFNRSPNEIERILKKAHKEYEKVTSEEFSTDELEELTEGYLQ
jgi:hypothetical protein